MRPSSYTGKKILIFLLLFGTVLSAGAAVPVKSRVLLEKLQLNVAAPDSLPAVSAGDQEDAIELWRNAALLSTCGDTLSWVKRQIFEGAITANRYESTIQRCLDCLKENPEGAELLRVLPDSFTQWSVDDYQNITELAAFLALEKQLKAGQLYPDMPEATVAFFSQQLDRLIQQPNPLISLQYIETELQKIQWAEADIRDLMLMFGKIKMHQQAFPMSRKCFQMAGYLQPDSLLPGLDSVFVARADSLSRDVMVPTGRRLFAQSLHQEALILIGLHDSLATIQQRFEAKTATADDSVRIPQMIERAYVMCHMSANQNSKDLRKAYRKRYKLNPQDMALITEQVLKSAAVNLHLAAETDPFSQTYRITLANSLYMQSAQNFADSSQFIPAAASLEKLTARQSGNWQLFYLLGNAYMGAGQWKNAIQSYEKARERVEKSAFLLLPANEAKLYAAAPDSTPTNEALLLNCYWAQAQAEIMDNQGHAALKSLGQAQMFAQDSVTANNISRLITAVSWDDGNIPAMNLRTRALEFQKKKDYAAAKAVYLQLLPVLWTELRRNEINNEIAMLDFVNLGLKDDGIERLRILTSALAIEPNGQPVDSVNTIYFENFGTMCYEYGNLYLEKATGQRTAFIYFMQATKFSWHGRPRAFINLAQLAAWNPMIAYNFAISAMKDADKLGTTEAQQLAVFLSDMCQQKADFDQAVTWYTRSQDQEWCQNPQL